MPASRIVRRGDLPQLLKDEKPDQPTNGKQRPADHQTPGPASKRVGHHQCDPHEPQGEGEKHQRQRHNRTRPDQVADPRTCILRDATQNPPGARDLADTHRPQHDKIGEHSDHAVGHYSYLIGCGAPRSRQRWCFLRNPTPGEQNLLQCVNVPCRCRFRQIGRAHV